MMITNRTPVSAETINAMLDEVLTEEHRGARAQADSAHEAEQAHLGERIHEMREQAADTRTAGLVTAIAGGVAATTSFIGSFTGGVAGQRLSVLGDLTKASGDALNAAVFKNNAALHGIAGEEAQRMASDSAHASRMALDRAGELRQMRDRVTNMVDRNEETRHATNMLFRA